VWEQKADRRPAPNVPRPHKTGILTEKVRNRLMVPFVVTQTAYKGTS